MTRAQRSRPEKAVADRREPNLGDRPQVAGVSLLRGPLATFFTLLAAIGSGGRGRLLAALWDDERGLARPDPEPLHVVADSRLPEDSKHEALLDRQIEDRQTQEDGDHALTGKDEHRKACGDERNAENVPQDLLDQRVLWNRAHEVVGREPPEKPRDRRERADEHRGTHESNDELHCVGHRASSGAAAIRAPRVVRILRWRNIVTERTLNTEAEQDRYRVASLGVRAIASPLDLSTATGDLVPDYVPDGTRVLDQVELRPGASIDERSALEKAGPRELIYFDPKETRAGIVTSGGLCPGINNVIRSITFELVHKYAIQSVVGFRFGFAGLDPMSGASEPVPLGPEQVRHIHRFGGTVLGTSRGQQEPKVMVDTLVAHGINLLFAIGGDGTMRGAHAIAREVERRGEKISVIGVPKTIDNDIAFVDKTFGFDTAVAMARTAIDAAHTEAVSAMNGIGLVKLMGREAGFIAAHSAMASHDVNVCLVPEVPFRLDGPTGLLCQLERRLADRHHAVIVVAEGCAAQLFERGAVKDAPRDASGNIRFQELDVGKHLKDAITAHFGERNIPITLKYIDPSYMLRGVPAGAIDSVFCAELARYAVHAAMAGKTDMMVGRLHRIFTHVPLPLVQSKKKRIDPDGELWLAVTESTGQPRFV